jgi:hypothetical protein
MRQDTDVARVAAALRAPAIRYRSFGNEPVRTPVAAPEPDPYALLGAAMTAAAEVGHQHGLPPTQPWQPPVSDAPATVAWQDVQYQGTPPQPSAHPADHPQATSWPEPTQPRWQEPAARAWPAPTPQPWPEAPRLVHPEASHHDMAPAAVLVAPQAQPELPERQASWPEPASRWAEPAVPAWPEPAATSWAEPTAQSWQEPVPQPWREPAAQAVAAPPPPQSEPPAASPAAAPPSVPVQPEVAAAEIPQPLHPAPSTPSAPAVVHVATPGWLPAPAAASPASAPEAVPAPGPVATARPAADAAVTPDMPLLRAAEAPRHAIAKPSLSTLAELSVAPPPQRPVEPRATAPRMLFPLIEALDLPGGMMAGRLRPVAPPAEGGAWAAPVTAPPALQEPEVKLPPILQAAEVDLPLPVLLRLLAADPAGTSPDATDTFLALRRPPRADRTTT